MEDHDVSIVAVLVGEKLMLQRISVPTGPPQHKNLCTTSKKCGPKGQQLPYGIELGLDSSNHLWNLFLHLLLQLGMLNLDLFQLSISSICILQKVQVYIVLFLNHYRGAITEISIIFHGHLWIKLCHDMSWHKWFLHVVWQHFNWKKVINYSVCLNMSNI